MARNSLLRPSLLRHFLGNKTSSSASAFSSNPSIHSSVNKTLVTTNTISPHLPPNPFSNVTSHHFSQLFFFCRRPFCSSTSPSNIVLIKSEEEFNNSLEKVQGDSLPAVFYFTAVWCGPCKFISPVIEELSKIYPHVTTYKIDIDLEGLGNTLSKLKIYSVPTFHFFQNGTKANEVIGADAAQLKATMENLYK